MTDNRTKTRTRNTEIEPLSLVCLALYFLWLELVLKDWFLSSVDPYPYRDSLAICLAPMVGFFLVSWPQRFLSPRALIAVAAVCGLCALGQVGFQTAQGLLWALGGGLTAVGVGSILAGAAPRQRHWLIRAVGVGTVVGIVCALWPHPFPEMTDAVLMGGGLGTGETSADTSFGERLVAEQGLVALAVLIFLLGGAVLRGLGVLCSSEAKPDARLASAGGIGVLAGLAAVTVTSAPFLTVGSLPGTWALALTLTGLSTVGTGINEALPTSARVGTHHSRRRKAIVLSVGIALGVVLLTAIHTSTSRQVQRYAGHTAPPGFSQFVPLSLVAVPMQDATVAMEDGHFYQHHGFDWEAMHRALRVNLRDGKIAQGGSTISQQLAKNLFLSHDRTVGRKLQEAALTWQLEHTLSKTRILELYLNKIDYGMGQKGIRAAAAYYFHTDPAHLTLAQSAILVGLVPKPPQTDGDLQMDHISEGQKTALERVAFFFPHRYSFQEIQDAEQIPLDHLMYPYKDAWDRGATQETPSTWHGVGFYFFAQPDQASPLTQVSASLLPPLGGFLEDAQRQYGLIGLDHLGVYNDRPVRGSQSVLSAHAFGQAIDISGFRFADGTRVSVKDHDQPVVAARLAPMEALLKKHFDLVIDWHDDPVRHLTHFHAEVKGPRGPVVQSNGAMRRKP